MPPDIPTDLDVIVEVMLLTDLDEKDLGVDPITNRATAGNVALHMDRTLRNAGYEVNMLRSGYGVAWTPPAEASVYLVDDRASTGVAFEGPEPQANGDPWIDTDSRAFLRTLLATGRSRRHRPEEAASQVEFAALAALPNPAAFTQLQSRYLLLVYTEVYHAAVAKEAAAVLGSIAVGVAMMAAGSPVALVPTVPTSYSSAELVLFDTEKREIVWSAGRGVMGDSPRKLEDAVSQAARTFPTHPGGKARYSWNPP